MNRWEAREVIRRGYPEVAAVLDKVIPLGPAPPPCTCPPGDLEAIRSLRSYTPVATICVGRCR